jgi:tetratricopeptide (TPR) repeat protein
MKKRTTAIAALAVAASLALAGCTADPSDGPSASSSSAPGTVSVADLLQLGIASAQAGDIDQARATFETVLAVEPGNAFANYNLGVLAQQEGDTAAAIAYYDAAIATDPNFTSAMYNKAILLEASDPDAAIELYRQIVSINDQAATAYFRLSLLLEAQGDTAGATEARDKALAIDPSLADAETGE